MGEAAEIRIGTSGWHYQDWINRFYPEHSSSAAMLQYYIQYFDTVELNNSFYRLPDVSTLQSWRNAVPRNFRFAVKASRFITHNKKLNDPKNVIGRFLPRVEALGAELGPVLFQLPPRWKVNVERLHSFLTVLPRMHHYTFEFREPSWNIPAVYELLQAHNAAYCIYELGGFLSPLELTANWAYVRLHGPGGKYQGSYPDRTLRQWAARIEQWSTRLKHIYIYFDNDESAYAPHNALELKRLVDQRLATARSTKAA